MDPLRNVSVVLVDPRTAGNIGSAARAMKNCGVTDLRIVAGTRARAEARRLAVHAEDVLAAARRFAALPEAVADAAEIVGFSSRPHRWASPIESWPAAAGAVRAAARKGRVALVFGREDLGLLGTEARLATRLVKLPAAGVYPVFNVAQAVLLACHSLAFGPKTAPGPPGAGPGERPDQATLESLMATFAAALGALGYGAPVRNNRTARILLRLRRQMERAGLSAEDIQLWRGLLARITDPPDRRT